MSEDIEEVLKPMEESFGSINLRKPTAGTLSLCDFAKLKITSGSASEVPFFEAIAFFYIHSQPVDLVRKGLFDYSDGKDENGCSLKFINTVLDWADNVELGSIADMGEVIGKLLQEAMSPKVEPEEGGSTEDDIAAIVTDTKKKPRTRQRSK